MTLFHKIRQQKLLSVTLMVFTLSIGILIGTLINTQVNAAKGQTVAPDATPLTVPKAEQIGNEFTKLAKKLEPSVVNITVEVAPKPAVTSRNRGRQNPDDDGSSDDPFEQFRRFFGGQGGGGGPQIAPEEALKREQSGTGFVVDKNGYIMTNRHVVDGGDKITVKMQDDSTTYKAKVIGTDVETDLAVIKIDPPRPLQTVTIGNSDAVQVGDWAVAIGSPFNLDETVTVGIVSAMGRDINAEHFQRFIQTDAAINPGNSGGPLLNIRGEVIGVNTMIATSRGGSEGVGFAVPSNMVVRVYNDIIRDGRVTRGSIGIQFPREIKPETLKGLGVDHGVIVSEVTKDGPAEKGGLKADDIILGINGKAIKDGDDLMFRVADTPVGNPLTLNIDRDGKKMDLTVMTQDRMKLYADNPSIVGDNSPASDAGGKAEAASSVKFGIGVRPVSDDERSLTPDKRGVTVTRVEQNSFAEDIGMQERDIIVAINRHPVNSTDDVRSVAQMLKPGDAVAFHVYRPAPTAPRAPKNGRGATADTPAAISLFLSGTLPKN